MARISELEERFKRYWATYSKLPLQCEFKDQRIRGKRNCLPYDFHVVGTNILIEVQGATHRPNTGHTSAKGIKRDCFKNNAAQMLGYNCFQFTGSMITHAAIKAFATYVETVVTTSSVQERVDSPALVALHLREQELRANFVDEEL